jgi:hypothetical protein
MCIAKDKGHQQELIMTFMSANNSFRNIHFFHANLVIARVEIKFGEELSTLEFIPIVINEWNGKFTLDN